MKKFLGLGVVIGFLFAGYLIFSWSPTDSAMGYVQKIMYIHVPSAWTAFLAIFIAFGCSIGYLWKRIELFDIVAHCSVEIGVIFCAFALITGSIWARPTWNTYWTWDARLTTTLILFLIFAGYLLLRRFSGYGDQSARLSAVIAILGFLDIPLIHLSVVWWRTLHQPSTMFSAQKNVIATPLLVTLLVSLAAFTLLFILLLSSRIELERKNRTYHKMIANLV